MTDDWERIIAGVTHEQFKQNFKVLPDGDA